MYLSMYLSIYLSIYIYIYIYIYIICVCARANTYTSVSTANNMAPGIQATSSAIQYMFHFCTCWLVQDTNRQPGMCWVAPRRSIENLARYL